MLPTSTDNVTYACRKCYLQLLKLLPMCPGNVTYVHQKCYLRLLKMLPTEFTYGWQKTYKQVDEEA